MNHKPLKPAEIAEAIRVHGDTEHITWQMLDWLYARHGQISVDVKDYAEARKLLQVRQGELFAEQP